MSGGPRSKIRLQTGCRSPMSAVTSSGLFWRGVSRARNCGASAAARAFPQFGATLRTWFISTRTIHTSCVKLNGIFHGLLVDRARGTATLFNDRYGMHRVYYHEGKDAFYFAAEAKAILAVCPELRSADPRGLGEFVACSCVLENRTIFTDIHVLPGASLWSFRNGSIDKKTTYFLPREWEEQDLLEAEPFYLELRDVFSRNLPATLMVTSVLA